MRRAITSTDMDAAITAGQAAPLSQTAPFIVNYQETWWLSTKAGWLPVPPPAAASLDEHAERLRHKDARTTASHAAIRAVINLATTATAALSPE